MLKLTKTPCPHHSTRAHGTYKKKIVHEHMALNLIIFQKIFFTTFKLSHSSFFQLLENPITLTFTFMPHCQAYFFEGNMIRGEKGCSYSPPLYQHLRLVNIISELHDHFVCSLSEIEMQTKNGWARCYALIAPSQI